MIFRLVQRNLAILGISRAQSKFTFYVKVFAGYLLLGSGIAVHFRFLFRDDVTFEEYTQSLNVTTMTVMSTLCFTIMVLEKAKFFKHIDNLESKIQLFIQSESKFKFFFIGKQPKYSNDHFHFLSQKGIKRDYPHMPEKIDEALRLAEKCSEIIHFIMVKVTPLCIAFPNVALSFYLYYIKGMGRGAFIMTDVTMS